MTLQLIKLLHLRTPQEKMARLAVLLSLQQPPTRQSLIKDAARFGIVQVICIFGSQFVLTYTLRLCTYER